MWYQYDTIILLRFQEQCGRAYLQLRKQSRLFLALFTQMLCMGIPELQKLDDVNYLKRTLAVHFDDDEGALRWVFLNILFLFYYTFLNLKTGIFRKSNFRWTRPIIIPPPQSNKPPTWEWVSDICSKRSTKNASNLSSINEILLRIASENVKQILNYFFGFKNVLLEFCVASILQSLFLPIFCGTFYT